VPAMIRTGAQAIKDFVSEIREAVILVLSAEGLMNED
jgi:hypothetical protein